MTPMRKLFFSMSVSLDGYIKGPDGTFEWAAPSEELHRFHNERVAQIGTQLLGRRLYETMLFWESDEWDDPVMADFARVWKGLERIVFSRTLDTVQGDARLATRGVAEEVAALKAQPGKPIAVGGAGLAAECTKRGLIDQYELFIYPVVAGGGTPYFPLLNGLLELELAETRTFGSNVVYLRYVVPALD
jgi:dihydrofolate reductase